MKRITYFCPRETTAKLRCPERGFYTILRFMADETPEFPEDFAPHPDDTLLLVEINLANYADGALSERALNGIDALFARLRGNGCGLIVRFLYDWSGRNLITEPKTVDVILGHIRQLGPLIRENADNIYLLQGLFVGHWGEMHGSRFVRADHLKRLYAALTNAVESRVRIAVRTPLIWQTVTGIKAAAGIDRDAQLPGLFNDAMLGNSSEYGTFSEEPLEREQQLSLLERVTRSTPYGGEVVGIDPLSDAQPAMAALAGSRVSYLNRTYDKRTLAKWESAAISDGSIRNGMSYFDYAETHLGYRFVIRGVSLRRAPLSGSVTADIKVENIGFAPIYHDTAAELVFVRENRESVFPMTGNVNRLLRETGARRITAKLTPPREQTDNGAYEIFFRLKSLKYKAAIPTANQGNSAHGCLIGRVTV